VQRLWDVDLDTGRGHDLGPSGPGGGQINDMVWDPARRRVYMGSYTSCTVIEYDPARGGRFPDNPRVFAKIGNGQMRPLQLLHDGAALWMTTSPHYGTLGGALSRIDLATGDVRVVRNLVPDQTPVRMLFAPGRRRIFLSMTIEGDCGSAIVKAPSAHLVVFDAAEMSVIRSFAPIPGALVLYLCEFDEDGRLLFMDGPRLGSGNTLWTWDTNTDEVTRVGAAPPGLWSVIPAPDGHGLWATGYEGIGPLIPGDPCRIQSVIDPAVAAAAFDRVCKFPQVSGGRLWFTAGDQFLSTKL
jgi:WD40 repeat protein